MFSKMQYIAIYNNNYHSVTTKMFYYIAAQTSESDVYKHQIQTSNIGIKSITALKGLTKMSFFEKQVELLYNIKDLDKAGDNI